MLHLQDAFLVKRNMSRKLQQLQIQINAVTIILTNNEIEWKVFICIIGSFLKNVIAEIRKKTNGGFGIQMPFSTDLSHQQKRMRCPFTVNAVHAHDVDVMMRS